MGLHSGSATSKLGDLGQLTHPLIPESPTLESERKPVRAASQGLRACSVPRNARTKVNSHRPGGVRMLSAVGRTPSALKG